MANRNCRRSASTVLGMSGYCSLQATSRPSGNVRTMNLTDRRRRRTRSCETPRTGTASQSQSSPAMRRRTKFPTHRVRSIEAVRVPQHIPPVAHPAPWTGIAPPSSAALFNPRPEWSGDLRRARRDPCDAKHASRPYARRSRQPPRGPSHTTKSPKKLLPDIIVHSSARQITLLSRVRQ